MDHIIVGTQRSSRYTFHPIFPRWLGSVLSLKRFSPNSPDNGHAKILKNYLILHKKNWIALNILYNDYYEQIFCRIIWDVNDN